jgi:nucleoporin SEH1
MSPMMEDPTTSQEGFRLLENSHKDMVGATAFNSYGDRFASSSVDGKIKVYNRHRDGTWVLCDTWTAHSAEIFEVLFPSKAKN